MSDRILGICCLLIAAFLIWQATQVQTSFIVDPLGPKAFPIIIGIVLAGAGLYPILRPDPEPEWPARGRLLEVGFAAVLMVFFAMSLATLGFVVAAALVSGLMSWRLGAPPLKAVLTGLGIAITIFVIFHLVLGIHLASGPWGF